nr:hypothetical protein [Oryza punctata]
MQSDAAPAVPAAAVDYSNLTTDLVIDIQGRLAFVDRLAVGAVFGAAGHAVKPEAPWLVLPGETPETNRLYSVSDRLVTTARAPDPAMRGCCVVGSSGGWVVTADRRAGLHMVNPVTGEQLALPAITTCPFFYITNPTWPLFHVNILQDQLIRVRCGGGGGENEKIHARLPLCTLVADQMVGWVYRKVVLSASPRPGGYAAMLLLDLDRHPGNPAFATSDDPTWRVASSPDGIEDAIHHRGKFYSITYSGVVEEWDRRDGPSSNEFTSRVVSPKPAKGGGDNHHHRKNYLVAAPGGKLMVVTKYFKVEDGEFSWQTKRRVCFEVQVLADEEKGGRWRRKASIGKMAVFVGASSNSVCLSTKAHPELRPDSVYFAADELAKGPFCRGEDGYHNHRNGDDKKKVVGVYSLKDGARADGLPELGDHATWPPPAWFTPLI